jgi:LacI family transcriptional regulator
MSATMKDIAKQAGVSLTTVSRALNNKEDIGKETRERILAIAQELNYAPNIHARALASGDSKTLGLIVADSANPFYAKIIRGVQDVCSAHEFGVILCNTNEQPEQEVRAHQMLHEKRVNGMLITSIRTGLPPLRELQKENIPFVLLNRYLESFGVDCVLNDNRQGAYEATAHLCKLGHRRIVHLTGAEEISSVRDRLAGYSQALREYGIPFDGQLVLHCNLRLKGGYRQAKTMIPAISPRPTAVFAYSDLLAIGVLKALRELGWRVPQDIALVGYDDIEFAPFMDPPLTTVAQLAYEIGQKGTEILLERINLPEGQVWTPQRIVFKPVLRVRVSSGAALEATGDQAITTSRDRQAARPFAREG